MRDSRFGRLLRTAAARPLAAVCLLAAAGVLAAACVLAAPGATPGAASGLYVTGEPHDGQELIRAPSRVVLRFAEPVRLDGATLEDEAGRGFDVRSGTPEDDAGTLTVLVRVAEALPPGTYRLRWSAYVPASGRVDDGALRFTVLAPR